MAVTTLALTAASKAASTWISTILQSWIKDKKSNATEARLWTEISNIVLKHTKATVDRYQKITTVAFPREPVTLDSIYIPLTIVNESKGQSAVIENFPKQLLEANRKLLIVDVAGMGKSTISKILYTKSLSERTYLPILIDLRRLDGLEEVHITLAKQFGLKEKHNDLFADFLTSQPLLFIFDGFDEVSDSKKIEVARILRDFIDRSENGTFVITSRPELPFSNYSDFITFHIRELTKNQAHDLIKKYGSAYGIDDRAKALLEELNAKHSNPVESFLRNPLLTSLLFRAFEYKSVIPVKRGVFYRQVFDALYESHDLSKETGYVRDKKTGLHHDDFHRALRAMAKLFRQRRVVEVNVDEFKSMAREISKSLCPDLTFTPEDILHDVLNAVPLFLRDGNLIRWAHKSLLDYFLCEFLLRDFPESKEEALRRASHGIQARANENFLVLVHEADPILFAEAITLPAIKRLIARYEKILARIPSTITDEMSRDIATFFMSHEVVNSPDSGAGIDKWKDSNNECVFDTADFTPQLIYQYDGDKGSLSVLVYEAALALHVPIAAGVIPHITIGTIAREYPRDQNERRRPKKVTAFINSRNSESAWSTAEEEFSSLMSLLHPSHLQMTTKPALEEAYEKLEKLVAASIKARSNDMF